MAPLDEMNLSQPPPHSQPLRDLYCIKHLRIDEVVDSSNGRGGQTTDGGRGSAALGRIILLGKAGGAHVTV